MPQNDNNNKTVSQLNAGGLYLAAKNAASAIIPTGPDGFQTEII